MDFPQQIEETLVERPASAFDVIMESPLCIAKKVDKMNSSMNSTLDDTTPSDSGVHMLDSESSELMIESITSQTGFEFEDVKEAKLVTQPERNGCGSIQTKVADSHVDKNSNVTVAAVAAAVAVEDAMTTSACSTFDATDNIVYRRKVRKSTALAKPPKKRVSFHEDILKNTRTDNIHIEHGFITYKSGRKLAIQSGAAGRYSWCSDRDGAGDGGVPTEICANTHEDDDDDAESRRRQRVVYRNACSDVLDYGNSDVFDTNEDKRLQYDKSGVFEYIPPGDGPSVGASDADSKLCNARELYRCSCSSSNSSLDSEESDKNSNTQQYGQAKSSSCDCIGVSNTNNNIISENCYYSEPSFENLEEGRQQKSVWNKEKKPKSSCLKKTKRHTNIILEQDLNTKVKKFNVHDMNQLIDNSSKMIFGSLKSIFTLPLPERGVPEGSEDLQSVVECIPEQSIEQTPEHKAKQAEPVFSPDSPPLKQKPFLSKSLDGSKQQQAVKQYVHNVDEQLRRKNDEELFAPTRQNSGNTPQQPTTTKVLQRQDEIEDSEPVKSTETEPKQFRNKFIINCESTVFEHTGVSYCYESNPFIEPTSDENKRGSIPGLLEDNTPIAQPEPDQLRNAFISAPIAKTFSNFFRSLKDSATISHSSSNKNEAKNNTKEVERLQPRVQPVEVVSTPTSANVSRKQSYQGLPTTTSSSTLSDLTNSTSSSYQQKSNSTVPNSGSLVLSQDLRNNLTQQSRHLPSPLKNRSLMAQPQRYGVSSTSEHSLDLFTSGYSGTRGSSGRDSKSTILSEEFDDILTITTDNDKNESDIVIVDYPELNDRQAATDYANLLKPPSTAKTSLINRFLRNVTQKKILESSIRKNNFFANKLKNEQKLFSNHLYVRGVRVQNYELIEDLNAEIAMEIEMSGANSPRRELANLEEDLPGDISRFELGIGEISVEMFNGNYLHILRDPTEQLMKVFKLYTGYSRDGFMTPVLVFLTDKTLYVTDLVRNRLCSKFVLAYKDLDVILMGPYGNTVLLSNSTRDLQQVLLAGGPYPADGLVANLELCARRSGSVLPAVGQLTLEHLAPLRAFVSENSSVDKNDAWLFYAVVNVPAGCIGIEPEPLGPHVKGFLMHRRVREHASSSKQTWNPGYFLLKAGVLYMFNDSSQKIPSWAMALAECQGARRAVKAGRPHCFEIMLKRELLQLAAPDEYVASEWLQALLQAASGLFEMQEKHKTLGRTLVITQNHLITLREDFTAPLRQINKTIVKSEYPNIIPKVPVDKIATDCESLMGSVMSTPTKCAQRSCSSINSTPTKLSQLSRSTATYNTSGSTTTSLSANTSCSINTQAAADAESYSNMSSVYGKNCGLEILTCADIKEMTGIKIPSHNDTWWCVLEFSCQEVRESSDDLVIFFASSSEMQRFLKLLEQLWQAKNNDLFPINILDDDDIIAEQCAMLYMDINRSWEPLLTAALGYPL